MRLIQSAKVYRWRLKPMPDEHTEKDRTRMRVKSALVKIRNLPEAVCLEISDAAGVAVIWYDKDIGYTVNYRERDPDIEDGFLKQRTLVNVDKEKLESRIEQLGESIVTLVTIEGSTTYRLEGN